MLDSRNSACLRINASCATPALSSLYIFGVLHAAGTTREILALQMHPMQKAVTPEELYKAVERALMTTVCQVEVLQMLPVPQVEPC